MQILDQPTSSNHQISFHGEGSKYFGIWIINLLLTFITLGLYYPWAKAAKNRYIYSETSLDDSRFQFHGTGQEMFWGFIKAVGLIIALYAMLIGSFFFGGFGAFLGVILFIFGMLALFPIAIHGSTKYRMSRTSWRGVHFGYRGDLKELAKECFIGGLLTIFTVGIYSFWFICKLREYIIGHIRFGNVKFEFRGEGFKLFTITIIGYFLTIFTFGIYSFWFMKDLFNFYINNIHATQDGRALRLRSNASGGGFLVLIIVNILLLIFTLGLAFPWVEMRTLNFVFRNIEIEGDFRPLDIRQTEDDGYRDAMGEDLSDMLDLGII